MSCSSQFAYCMHLAAKLCACGPRTGLTQHACCCPLRLFSIDGWNKFYLYTWEVPCCSTDIHNKPETCLRPILETYMLTFTQTHTHTQTSMHTHIYTLTLPPPPLRVTMSMHDHELEDIGRGLGWGQFRLVNCIELWSTLDSQSHQGGLCWLRHSGSTAPPGHLRTYHLASILTLTSDSKSVSCTRSQ